MTDIKTALDKSKRYRNLDKKVYYAATDLIAALREIRKGLEDMQDKEDPHMKNSEYSNYLQGKIDAYKQLEEAFK